MRNLIALIETYETTLQHYGKDYEIFRNPSRKEFIDLLNQTEFGFAKAVLLDNGDLIIWDANLLHDFTPYAKNCVARLELSEERVDWRHATSHQVFSRESEYKPYADVIKLIKNNIHLKWLYRNNFRLRDEESGRIY